MNPSPDVADHPARILIVDDHRHNRQLLEVMLRPEGFHLLTAASGEEALAMVAQQPPDLILLNIMMPGMDGYEVAKLLKSKLATKHIPIIMVTALADREARMLGLNAGAEDFLTKPVDRAELCVRVRNLLRLKAYGDYYGQYSQTLEHEVRTRTADLAERTEILEQQAAALTEQAALLDLAPDAIVVRDMNSRILFWSRGAEIMYGWLAHEALGRTTHELLQTDFPEPLEQIEASLLRQSQWAGEVIHHKRDGTTVIVSSRWALQRATDGAPVRVLTINNDITRRTQADAELQLLTERLSLATAIAQVGVWEWDLASDRLTWDATMCDIYGLEPNAQVTYAQWSALIVPEDLPAIEGSLQRVIRDKDGRSLEYRVNMTDGSVKTVSSVARVVLDERANVIRLIGVNMDITARTESEQALQRNLTDQLRFKDEFLSHVSHELRSPLTAIKQFTTILLGGLAGS
jgi:PAS domain S-box-containing protein